jgi:hypothetical protein
LLSPIPARNPLNSAFLGTEAPFEYTTSSFAFYWSVWRAHLLLNVGLCACAATMGRASRSAYRETLLQTLSVTASPTPQAYRVTANPTPHGYSRILASAYPVSDLPGESHQTRPAILRFVPGELPGTLRSGFAWDLLRPALAQHAHAVYLSALPGACGERIAWSVWGQWGCFDLTLVPRHATGHGHYQLTV